LGGKTQQHVRFMVCTELLREETTPRPAGRGLNLSWRLTRARTSPAGADRARADHCPARGRSSPAWRRRCRPSSRTCRNAPSPPALIADQDAGALEVKELRAKGEQHPSETTGRKLRGLMSWVASDDDYTEGTAAR
jgi:hypothetical protein